MGYYRDPGGTFYYSNAGTNTMTQVQASPCVIFDLDITNSGGSVGYLQVYNGGSALATGSAGTPDYVYSVAPNAQQGTFGYRDLDFPTGRQHKGFSYLWSAGATGTVAHGVNLQINITYVGTYI